MLTPTDSLDTDFNFKFLQSSREKILFEITTVKEEMSHAFNVLFTDKAKCSSIRIAEPWYAAT